MGLSFEIPESTCSEIAGATLTLLEICRDLSQPPRFYHASSSEVFGRPNSETQNEDTPFRPVNPYGCAKAFATNICKVYREAHGLFICNGIAYNHESPRRGENFVTKKITSAAVRIAAGSNEILELGNLDSERDWGYAPEYADAMWRILQHSAADDYILATGTATTVRDFALAAFEAVGINAIAEGDGIEECGYNSATGEKVYSVNHRYFRPAEPACLVGDARKAQLQLGWKAKISGGNVASEMIAGQ